MVNMIGNRKEEGRVCAVILHAMRKSSTPSENIFDHNSKLKKAPVCHRIRTQHAQTECHHSTTRATTTIVPALCCFSIFNELAI